MVLASPAVPASALFVMGQPVAPWIVPCIVALVAYASWRQHGRAARAHIGGAALIVGAACLISASFFDLSFDGQTYHQVAARAIAGGWNPVWQSRDAAAWAGGLYVEALPKGAWLLFALVSRTSGNLELAKSVQFIAMAGAFLLSWSALESIGVRRRAAVAIAALTAANPVALTQLLTFYVDGLVASSLTMLIAVVILLAVTRQRRWAVAAVLLFSLLATIKFPATLWALLVGATGVGLAATRARARVRQAIALAAVACGTTLLEGINPFATNALHHGHPLYPAAGPNAIQNVVHFDPTFAARSRLSQLTISLLARSSDNDSQPPRLKVPLSVHAAELAAFTTVDTRIGGWGPLFGGILLAAFIALAAALASKAPRAPALALFSTCVATSALIIPFGHYSRYAPHLWLAGVAALLIDELRGRATKLIALLMATNLTIVGGVAIGSQVLHERLHRQQLRGIADAAHGDTITVAGIGPFVNVDLHFRAYGIRYQFVDALTCDQPARLLKTHARICLSGGRSPAPEPQLLPELKRSLPRALTAQFIP